MYRRPVHHTALRLIAIFIVLYIVVQIFAQLPGNDATAHGFSLPIVGQIL